MADRSERTASPGDRLKALLGVKPGRSLRLDKVDPAATFGHEKEASVAKVQADQARLASLQDRLWAEAKHPVLVVLQGIDAAGKDGTIRHVMGAFNPQGCPVTSFKAPTSLELAHDYLWRVHQKLPARGEIGIFNRSHYEEVLIVRVHGLVPKTRWSRRYAHINEWERMLTEEGITIVKFFLYIDRDEQRDRLQSRVDEPTKRWKFRSDDLAERARWNEYVAAYDDMLTKTSTEWAPWYVIPANRNWFRNLAVSEILADSLEDLKPQYPPAEEAIEKVIVE